MKVAKDICKLNFDSIPIEPFWNIGDEPENKMHKIHAYPAKFPAFITTKALEYAKNRGANVKVIADIFCGCGTTAYEASRNGKNFWGCDINPVATLIAQAKSKKYNEKKLEEYYKKIQETFINNNILQKETQNVNDRIKYWFKPTQIGDLLKLRSAIYTSIPPKSFYRKFFLNAFSNILKPTSVWLTKSIKPQVDPEKEPANVFMAFASQVKIMIKANIENQINNSTDVQIENINFLEKKIDKSCADLIVTSPPYVTSYEYADLHQLSSLWLDFTDDYKSFREGTIGSLYNNSDYNSDLDILNKTGKEIILQLFEVDKRKAKSAAKYFVDMQKSVQKAYDLLNSNGFALFVIGNTEYKSVRIDNAKHLVECMIESCFTDIEVTRRKISKKILTPYRDKSGKFTTDKNSRKVYSEEFIVIGRKK